MPLAAGEEKVLHVYNWADYIGENTIRDFEARTGIKVVYDVYDASEVLQTKLLTGRSGYDVVVTSGGPTQRLIEAGALRKLDRSKLRNLANLDPKILQLVATYDPGNEHAVPYLWGTTGIGYNPDRSRRCSARARSTAWPRCSIRRSPRSSRSVAITWLDSPADMFQLAFVYLGLDRTASDRRTARPRRRCSRGVRPYVRYFHSSQYLNDLASGEVCVSVGWSGGDRAGARAWRHG